MKRPMGRSMMTASAGSVPNIFLVAIEPIEPSLLAFESNNYMLIVVAACLQTEPKGKGLMRRLHSSSK
eukprot:scaffold159885_cov36-Prasinocladus_malaysianus.AAC.2